MKELTNIFEVKTIWNKSQGPDTMPWELVKMLFDSGEVKVGTDGKEIFFMAK